jgi:putative DNA primase/helicase
MSAEPMMRWAFWYAGLGYRVFALHNPARGRDGNLWCSCGKADCSSAAKHPRTHHGVQDATTEEGQIREWWHWWPDANIGIATGNGIFVLDVDNRAGGDSSLRLLCDKYGQLPETPMVLTGGSGFHYYFRLADGVRISNSAGGLGLGLDIKTDGGYVVAPPSLHFFGKRYEWEHSARINEVAIADAPQWLLDLLAQKSRRGSGQGFRATDHHIYEGEGRNTYLYRLGRSEKARGHSEAVIRAAMTAANQADCNPPVEEAEFEKILHSVLTQADRPDFEQAHDETQGTLAWAEKVINQYEPKISGTGADITKAYEPCYIEAAAIVSIEDGGRYERLKAVLKSRGISIGSWERRMREAERRIKQERLAREKAGAKQANQQSGMVFESLAPPTPDPWPTPVTAAAVLDEVRDFVKRFVVVTEHALTAIVLWIAFTYFFEIAETSPRLAILSPVRRCGKTTLLEILSLLCPRAITASNVSPSAIFRTIDLEHPTLIVDEADTWNADKNAELRGILNSGHHRANAYVIRSVPAGDDWKPRKFSTWCPMAMAAIDKLPDTWLDRSIVTRMERKPVAVKVERLTQRNKDARKQAVELRGKLARLAKDNLDLVRQATPALPNLASDRALDNWEHPCAIGELAGPEWAMKARIAAMVLSAGHVSDESSSLGELLLCDLCELFGDSEYLTSVYICEQLAAREDRPWPEYRHGKPISTKQLASLLRPFGIKPGTVGGVAKGYKREWFKDVFDRYVFLKKSPLPLIRPVQTSNPNGEKGKVAISHSSKMVGWTDRKSARSPTGRRTWTLGRMKMGGWLKKSTMKARRGSSDWHRSADCQSERPRH